MSYGYCLAMNKTCFKCKSVKPVSEFYKHSEMADGYLGKCKSCAKSDSRIRSIKKSKDPAWVASEAERHRIKQARYRSLGLASPVTSEARKKWCLNNRHKRRAQGRLIYAVRSGKVSRPDRCQKCHIKSDRIQAHHHDYSKPLDVLFLCPACHGKEHRKYK